MKEDAEEALGPESSAADIPPDYATPDWLLQRLVWSANEFEGAMSHPSLILFVGGLVVVGELIGAREYTRLERERIAVASRDGSPVTERREDIMKSLLAGSEDDYSGVPEEVARYPRFIHLAEVRVVSSPELRLAAWRGRLTAVDGFAVGGLSSE